MKSMFPLAAVCLAVLFFGITSTEPAPAQNAVGSQQRFAPWEYKVLRPPTDNGFIRDYELEKKLDDLGAEGWEFAGTISDVRKDRTYVKVVLKRQER